MRSLSTSPLVTRSPTRVASSNSASTARGEVGAEDQRGRGAGAGQAVDEVGGDPGGVRRVGEARLLGQRAALEPVEQRHAEAADRAYLREVHVRVDEPRQHQPLAQVDDLVIRVLGEQRAGRPAGHDDAVAHDDGGVRLGAQVVALEGALRGVEEGAEEDRHRRCLVSAAPSRSNAASSSAATATAIAAGSLLVVTPGRPMGVRIRSTARRVVTVGEQLRPEPRQLGRRPDQPDRAEVVEPDGGVAEGDVLGVVVGHHQQVRAGRQLGEHELGQHRHRVHVHGGDSVGQRRRAPRRTGARRGSRRGAGRGRGGPGCARARGRRGRPRRSRRSARPAAARAAPTTSPPQHCTPCLRRRLVGKVGS